MPDAGPNGAEQAAGRAMAGAAQAGPGTFPAGTYGVAALLGIQRAAGNRAATAMVQGMQAQTARQPAAPRREHPAATADAAASGGWLAAERETPPDDAAQADGATAVDVLRPAGAPPEPPGASAAMVQREPVVQRNPGGPNPKFSVAIEPEDWKQDFGKTSYIMGSYGIEGEISGEIAPKGGGDSGTVNPSAVPGGGKVDVTLAERKALGILQQLGVEKTKETLSAELSMKKLEVSYASEATLTTPYPWLKGLVEFKFIAAGVEWKKPQEAVAAGVKLSGGLTGEGPIPLDDQTELKVSAKLVGYGQLQPNWIRIMEEVGQRVGQEGGKMAVEAVTTAAGTEVIAIDLAGLAVSAAAIIVPLAAALLMGAGAYQEAKNTAAAREAAEAGVVARKKAEDCAAGYARTLTGGAPGGDEGSTEAEAQIKEVMAKTGGTRELVIAATIEEQGGYSAIYDKNLKRIKDKIYAQSCLIYDASHQEDFGWLESLGPEWGMRGVYRTYFRIVLYGGS